MAGAVDRVKFSCRDGLPNSRAQRERNRMVFSAPDEHHRNTGARHALIYGVHRHPTALDTARQQRMPKTPVLHLRTISLDPIRKLRGVDEIAGLAFSHRWNSERL